MKRARILIALGAFLALLAAPLGSRVSNNVRYRDEAASSASMPALSSPELSGSVELSVSSVVEPSDPVEPEELWTDFQSFLDWFTRVVLPWLVAFFTSGGAGILIFKIAQMVANQLKVKKVVAESTEELQALRDRYAETLKALTARDELLAALIAAVINAGTRAELEALFAALPSPAALEASRVTEKIRLKVRRKKDPGETR